MKKPRRKNRRAVGTPPFDFFFFWKNYPHFLRIISGIVGKESGEFFGRHFPASAGKYLAEISEDIFRHHRENIWRKSREPFSGIIGKIFGGNFGKLFLASSGKCVAENSGDFSGIIGKIFGGNFGSLFRHHRENVWRKIRLIFSFFLIIFPLAAKFFQRTTSILPKLLPYLALVKKVYFCGRCSR